MGNQISQLRESSLMTKLMLKAQQDVVKHLQDEKIQLNRPLNQMGDRITHYAAYKSMYRLLQWLIENGADFQAANNRYLKPVDVAIPQVREWLFRKLSQYQKRKSLLQQQHFLQSTFQNQKFKKNSEQIIEQSQNSHMNKNFFNSNLDENKGNIVQQPTNTNIQNKNNLNNLNNKSEKQGNLIADLLFK